MHQSTAIILIIVIVIIVLVILQIIRFNRCPSIKNGVNSRSRYEYRKYNQDHKMKILVEGRREHNHHHGDDDDCVNCKDGGLDALCYTNEHCACGLKCLGGKCECPKPPPPQVQLQVVGDSITATWHPVPGADYYDLYLLGASGSYVAAIALFFEGTVYTFPELSPGNYYLMAFSGSRACGQLEQFTQAGPVDVEFL